MLELVLRGERARVLAEVGRDRPPRAVAGRDDRGAVRAGAYRVLGEEHDGSVPPDPGVAFRTSGGVAGGVVFESLPGCGEGCGAPLEPNEEIKHRALSWSGKRWQGTPPK